MTEFNERENLLNFIKVSPYWKHGGYEDEDIGGLEMIIKEIFKNYADDKNLEYWASWSYIIDLYFNENYC
tara:strand:- start:1316 stop:1525 length:210 start_codon:yes stop_codon:yes gene_type:complete